PYLFVKMFRTPVLRDGVALDYPVTALLRYNHLPLQYKLSKFGDRLRNAGILRETPLGGGLISVLDTAKAVKEGIDALQENLHFFLAAAPDYVDTEFPVF
ncbi:MAG: hypothetical protein HN377_01820, partial [Alphaproteobacteria bacterium]|nr:hypothetical protein [Alphaproteobacteria bacterium]